MIVRTIAVAAIVVACFAHGEQSLSGYSSSSASSGNVSVFFNAAADSALASNIQAQNASLATMQTNVDGLGTLATGGQTKEVRDCSKLITKTVGRLLKLFFRFTKSLFNLASDKTIPIEELFEQFKKAYDKLITFMRKDDAEFKQSLRDNLGVTVAQDFETKWKKIGQELINVAANADRLKKAVLLTQNRHDESQVQSRASITQLVTIFVSSIAKLKTASTDLTTAVASIATGLSTSNIFLTQVIGTRNSTRATVKSTKSDLKTSVLNERKSGLDKYYGAQSKIRTDLSAAISKLAIFSTSKKLNRLSRMFDDSYYELYHFLRQRNRTDPSRIAKDYYQIWENLEDIFDKSVEIFFYAMRRTYMRLADVVFESSFYNDYCYTTYTYSVPTKYQAISTLISDCTTREKTRWMAIGTAIQDEVTLLQSNSEELAMNIARCATYTNFITASADYTQAEACLKTNLEDMRELSFMLKPQFENLVNLVKTQVSPTKYRLENCFVSKLHELTALLKSTREAMNECSGRFDSHPRESYEDDESDWYNRHRGQVCEGPGKDTGKDSGEHGLDDIDSKPKKDTLKCKKREDTVDKNEKESNERDSEEKFSGEKKTKKNKKDKNNIEEKIVGGEDNREKDSLEKDSSEKQDKIKKDKKDKHNKDKDKNDSEELDSLEKGGELSSEEKDSEEKTDKKDKKKPDKNKNSSEEEKKDPSKEKFSGENSEEEFER